MKEGYRKLGEFIEPVTERNRDLKDIPLMGLSINKVFIPSIANTIGTDMAGYRVIERDYFAYGPVTSRNGEKITIALFKDYDKALISQAYVPFKIKKPKELLSDYLMMWFSRPEFDRYARYHSHGSARETFDWDAMCDVELPVPSPTEQQKIIDQYHSVENKIKTNEAICEKLEAAAQTLYKHWFVDFEFPCLPENYKFSGTGEPEDYKSVLTYKRVGGLPIPKENTWFVYLILCENDSIYKGMTTDLYRRFYEHYTGVGADWAKTHKPVKVIHWEAFDSKEKAAKREKELKTGYGRTWIQRQIEKAGGLDTLISGLPASKTELRTAGKMIWNEELEKEIPEGWEVGRLKDLCGYSNKRVPVKNLNLHNYISTENMLPDRGGVTISNNLPSASSVTNFNSGNILISNIRPYFKKIWLAEFNGGCSNDVLCLVPKNIVFTTYLYQILEKDIFFDFVMAGSKGTKMPRGDKEWIMSYQIIIPKEKLIEEYERVYTLILQNRKSKLEQNQKLRQLQDLLLAGMVKGKE